MTPQKTKDALWAQRLDLGWVVLGKACSNSAYKPSKIGTFKNHFIDNDRPSSMDLCPCLLYLECEAALNDASSATCQKKRHLVNELFEGNLGTNALVRTKDDNKPGTSVDDRTFVQIIHGDMIKDRESGSWTAPLPVSEEMQRLSDNREISMSPPG